MHSSFTRGFRRAINSGLFALIGLAAASSAQAQLPVLGLGSGDSATVSNSGTVGVIGGVPINNNISGYSSLFGTVVQTSGTAAFTLAGGSLAALGGTDLSAGGSGPVTISGGSIAISHGAEGLVASGSGPVIISGGTFQGDSISESVVVASGAAVQITGGYFGSASPLYVASGGSLYLFSKNDTPFIITGIPGQPFTGTSYDNTSLSLASIPSNQLSTYGISGTLADGESFSANLMGRGTIDFNLPVPAAVPEASATISFGLLLTLGLGGIALAKRKKLPA